MDTLLKLAYSVYSQKGVFALLLASGVSRSAGIPTGWEVTLKLIETLAEFGSDPKPDDLVEWYKREFQSEPAYDDLLQQLGQSPADRSAIVRQFLEPTEEERAEGLKTPTPAHKAIASLIARGYFRVIVTPNFDRLLEQALAEVGVQPKVINLSTNLNPLPSLQHDPLTVIKVHGDLLENDTRNIAEELVAYPDEMKALLRRVFDEYGLIVSGWSVTYDKALAQLLLDTNTHRYSTYWSEPYTITDKAKEVIAARHGEVIGELDSDAFFVQLEEKITALEDMTRSRPLSTQVAVATLKRYLPDSLQRIKIRDMIHDETTKTVQALDFISGMEAMSDQDFINYLQASLDETERLRALLIAGSRWGNRTLDQEWANSITRIASPPPTARRGTNLTYIQMFASWCAFYSVGIAAVASGDIGHLISIVKRTCYFRDDKLVPFLEDNTLNNRRILVWAPQQLGWDSYAPLNGYLLEHLRSSFVEVLPLERDYERCFLIFEFWCGFLTTNPRAKPGTNYDDAPIGLLYSKTNLDKIDRDINIFPSDALLNREEWEPYRYKWFHGKWEYFTPTYEQYLKYIYQKAQ